MAAIDASQSLGGDVNEVAFDLFTASMRSANMADVRLVLLVMAIECLLARTEREEATRAHLAGLVEQTLAAEMLDTGEREAVANALRSLKYVSTTRAARALAESLPRAEFSEDPVTLIPSAFKMRHALVHGGSRPDLDRVRYVGAVLERMVGALIAGSTVTQEVLRARADSTTASDW